MMTTSQSSSDPIVLFEYKSNDFINLELTWGVLSKSVGQSKRKVMKMFPGCSFYYEGHYLILRR
jgi:hypothetical protein